MALICFLQLRGQHALSLGKPAVAGSGGQRGLPGVSVVGVGAIASCATDSCEAAVCTVATFGSSSVGFLISFGVTVPIGVVGLGRPVLWQVGLLDLGLLLGERGRSHRGIGLRSRRQVGLLGRRRRSAPRRCRSHWRRASRRRHRWTADARTPAPRRRACSASAATAADHPQPPGGPLSRRDQDFGISSISGSSRLCRFRGRGRRRHRQRPRAQPA